MNILIVDDHGLFRDGIKLVLRRLTEEVDIREASKCAEALRLAAEGDFDLILLDLGLPDMDGREGLAKLRQSCPSTPIVIVSGSDQPWEIKRAISGGAMGFIPKSMNSESLLNALTLVLSGDIYVPPDVMKPSAGAEGVDWTGLTPRQLQVLDLLARGLSNGEIATALEISENTVSAHIKAILEALDAGNRTEAAYKALSLGIVRPGS